METQTLPCSVAPSASKRMIAAVRQDFATVASHTYLDIASCAPLSGTLQRAVASYLSDPEYGFDKEKGIALVEQTRILFAQLINAQADDIAVTKNISEGLNCVANAIDWRVGDNIVVCPFLEHPNNRYLWLNLAQRLGVELRLIVAPGHEYPIEAMVAAIDERTRLVAISSVSYVPGFLTPLAMLCEVCREKDVLLLVDAAQSVGPLHTDVQALGIDALTVSTQKGLLGVYGLGFLYVRPQWAERLHPVNVGKFGVDEKLMQAKGLLNEPLALRQGARRFDVGNYNLVGVVAAKESLQLLTSVGTQAIQAHNIELAQRLSEGLMSLGLTVCLPQDQQHQAHVVSLGSLNPATGAAQIEFLHRLYVYLEHNHVRASWRNGILRFSIHLYNNMSDIQTVLGLVRQYAASNQAL